MWTNKTIITKNNVLFFNTKNLNYTYLIIAIGIIGVVCGIFLTILKSSFYLIIIGFGALILGGLFSIFKLFSTYKNYIGTTLNYTFNQDSFLCGSTEIQYANLLSIVENNSTLILYVDKKHAFIVDKTTLPNDCLQHVKAKTMQNYVEPISENN